MVKAVVFDIGNVLLRFDFGMMAKRVAPFCKVSMASVPSLVEPLKMELERGRISGDAFLREVASLLGFSGDFSLLRAAWQEIFEPIAATHQLVRLWRGKYPLYLLSNTNDLHAEYFLKTYDVFSCFDGAVFSHEAGVMKPDAGIYEHAENRFGLEPGATLLIDDLLPNVESAKAKGWMAHHYCERAHENLVNHARLLRLL
jgi:putative hydrolase of the HAD superfamily